MLAGAADVKPDLLDLHLCARVIPSLRDERQFVMVKSYEARNYEDAVQYLRDHGFDVLDAPATNNRVFLKKTNVSAAIEKDAKSGEVKVFARPGYLIGGEISKLVDRGYQKFLKTTKTEVPATADHLQALHQFSEELHVATGVPVLYNESLGSVSDAYVYDRVQGRDVPEEQRKPRPWEKQKAKQKRPA